MTLAVKLDETLGNHDMERGKAIVKSPQDRIEDFGREQL